MSLESIQTWNLGRELAVKTYRLCELLPKTEKYALSDQMRRAAVSVASNIAEGYGRGSTKEYVKFLFYAKGSVLELKTQIMIAEDTGLLNETQTKELSDACEREISMLSHQIESLINRV